jgi:sec-independent protein translocase protein TatA
MILFGIPGPTSLLIVLVIVLLLFGSRLPSTMRSLGRGVTEFKKGLAGEDEGDGDNPAKVKSDDKQASAK